VGHGCGRSDDDAIVVACSAPKLLDRVREAIRVRHYSRRTEEAYVTWIRRFILFHGKRHPSELGSPEVAGFVSSLAIDRDVSVSTQNQALSAVLFLYRDVLGISLDKVNGIVRASARRRLPVVLTRREVSPVMAHLEGPSWLVVALLYGAVSGCSRRWTCVSRISISSVARSPCGRAGAEGPSNGTS
jgi:integrase